MKRKGQFFELDLIIAIVILVAGVLLLKAFFIQDTLLPQVERSTQDVVVTLQTLTMEDVDPGLRNYLDGEFDGIDGNTSVARQIVIFIVEGRDDLANTLAEGALNTTLPQGLGINISLFDGNTRVPIYETTDYEAITDEISQSKTLLSGLEIGQPIEGFSGTLSLTQATNNLATYAYFGGFVGQGNLTTSINLPVNVVEQSLEIEGDFKDDFHVIVNGVNCESVSVGLDVTYEDITSGCLSEIVSGENVVEIIFSDDNLSNQYVGGGYLKLSYENHYLPLAPTSERIHLTGIDGIFNLYDSITVPGKLLSMEVFLDYYVNRTDNNESIFFGVGNYTVFEDNDSSSVTVFFDDNDLDQSLGGLMDYDLLSGTVPIRLGYLNLTGLVQSAGLAHVALITDVSGSMGGSYFGFYNMDTFNCTYNYDIPPAVNLTANCYMPNLIECEEPENTCSIDYAVNAWNHSVIESTVPIPVNKLELAQFVGKDFAEYIIEANIDNGVGLVAYSDYTVDVLEVTNDLVEINNTINSYTDDGYTCVACGIINATALINESPNQYSRSMVVMSDGQANRCYNDANYCSSGVSCYCTPTQAAQQALEYATLANASNITLYSVAFALNPSSAGYLLMQNIAALNNGSYEGFFYEGSDPGSIEAAYGQIAQQIILAATYENQVVVFEEDSASELFRTSYIDIEYQPWPSSTTQIGSILVNGEASPFIGDSCIGTVEFSPSLTPVSGTLTSYSGDLWTSQLIVNGNDVYDLDIWGNDYITLGDPFSIAIPPSRLDSINVLDLTLKDVTGASSDRCSDNNKLHFVAEVNSTLILSNVYPFAEGCNWLVKFESDPAPRMMTIPDGVVTSNDCEYTPLNNYYDNNDAYQVLAQNLFETFDVAPPYGEVDVDFDAIDLVIKINSQSEIPYLWGPAILEVVVWR